MAYEDISPWKIHDYYEQPSKREYSLSSSKKKGGKHDYHSSQKNIQPESSQISLFRVKHLKKPGSMPRSYSEKEQLPIGSIIIDQHIPFEQSDKSIVKHRLSLNTLKTPQREFKKVQKAPSLIENHSTPQLLKYSIQSILKSQKQSVPRTQKVVETLLQSKLEKVMPKTRTIEFRYDSPLKQKLARLQNSKKKQEEHILDRLLGRWE